MLNTSRHVLHLLTQGRATCYSSRLVVFVCDRSPGCHNAPSIQHVNGVNSGRFDVASLLNKANLHVGCGYLAARGLHSRYKFTAKVIPYHEQWNRVTKVES